MKIIARILPLIFFLNTAKAAELYRFDPNHVNINWSANHFGFSSPSGKFTQVEGTLLLDEKSPQKSSVDLTIKINSLNTGIADFDNHLKSRDFFDAEKFPTAKFVSKSVAVIGYNKAKINGDLTIHGITKPIILDARLNKIGNNPYTQKKTAGFSASTIIRRSQFGIPFGIPGISDNVKIDIEAEAIIDNSAAETKISSNDWKIVDDKSKIEFKAVHGNSTISGAFKNFYGTINFDLAYLQNCSTEIEIDTSSVVTSFSEASKIIQGAEWLSTKAFPKAIFKSNKFVVFGNAIEKRFQSVGTLSLKGKTTPVVLDFTIVEFSEHSAHVIGSTILKRSDFDIGNVKSNKEVKDEIEVKIDIYATK